MPVPLVWRIELSVTFTTLLLMTKPKFSSVSRVPPFRVMFWLPVKLVPFRASVPPAFTLMAEV